MIKNIVVIYPPRYNYKLIREQMEQVARAVAAQTFEYFEDDTPPSLKDLEDNEALCEHCHCTEYGLSMTARNISAFSSGCEGSYCEDAYAQYLDDFKEERPWLK